MVTMSLREPGCHLRGRGIALHTRPRLEQPAACTARRLPDPAPEYRRSRMLASAAHVLGYNRPPRQAPASTPVTTREEYLQGSRPRSPISGEVTGFGNQRRVRSTSWCVWSTDSARHGGGGKYHQDDQRRLNEADA